MKTDVYSITQNGRDFSAITAAAKKSAEYNGLDEKSSLRLQLLSEEVVCMLPRLLKYGNGKFWIENKGKKYELHTSVTIEEPTKYDREKILAVSSSGKNAAAVGIIGKICTAIEYLLEESARAAEENPYPFYSMGMDGYINENQWSLTAYRNSFEAEDVRANYVEEWDELEKSIIANLADNVTVSIAGGEIYIVVEKTF